MLGHPAFTAAADLHIDYALLNQHIFLLGFADYLTLLVISDANKINTLW
jgi:hypothetical protein